ncbi:MAG TPA: O-antigen ligase family protein [Herpetosiphonaceae bacterium]
MQLPQFSSKSIAATLQEQPALRALGLVLLCLLVGTIAGAAVSFGPFWLGFAGLIAVLGGIALLRSTDMGLAAVFAVIALLPFGALPFKIAVTPTFLELALIALLGITALRVLALPELDVRMSALGGPLLAWLGLTIFSLVLGAGGLPDNLTLHNYLKFVLGVLLFFGVINVVRTRAQMRFAFRVVIGGGAAAALIGLALYALNDQTALRLLVALGRLGYPTSGRVLRYVEDDPGGLERAIGTAIDPNSFGGTLALICALTTAQLWARRPVLPRWLLAGMAAAMALCTFLTYSRAALGGLVVATLFLAIVRERRLWWLIGGAAAAGAIAIFGLGLGDAFVERIVEGVQFRDQANQMRLAEFRNALEIIRRYPVFGVGFGAGPELGLITGVSSIYLAMAERIGLVGLGVFIGICATFFAITLRAIRRIDEERSALLLGVQAGIVAALAVGLLDHYYFNIEFSHMAALFWGVTGLGMVLVRDDLPETLATNDDS